MGTPAPEWVQTGLLFLVPTLLIVLGVGVPILSLVLPNIADTEVSGTKFWFKPISLQRGFNHAAVQRFMDLYCEHMPQAFRQIGKIITSEMLADHFKKVRCEFKQGALSTNLRSHDLDNDGTKETLTGLTLSETRIQVGVLDAMLLNGDLAVERTALTYELHNTAIWRFAGYAVALGESFVDVDDKSLVNWFGPLDPTHAKAMRATLDQGFSNVTMLYKAQ